MEEKDSLVFLLPTTDEVRIIYLVKFWVEASETIDVKLPVAGMTSPKHHRIDNEKKDLPQEEKCMEGLRFIFLLFGQLYVFVTNLTANLTSIKLFSIFGSSPGFWAGFVYLGWPRLKFSTKGGLHG